MENVPSNAIKIVTLLAEVILVTKNPSIFRGGAVIYILLSEK